MPPDYQEGMQSRLLNKVILQSQFKHSPYRLISPPEYETIEKIAKLFIYINGVAPCYRGG